MNQLYVYIYPHISSLLHLPPTLPIPPLQAVTKHQADFPVLCSCFPLAIYFTFGSIHMSMPLSHFVPAYPSPAPVSSSPFSTSASLFLLQREFLQKNFQKLLAVVSLAELDRTSRKGQPGEGDFCLSFYHSLHCLVMLSCVSTFYFKP